MDATAGGVKCSYCDGGIDCEGCGRTLLPKALASALVLTDTEREVVADLLRRSAAKLYGMDPMNVVNTSTYGPTTLAVMYETAARKIEPTPGTAGRDSGRATGVDTGRNDHPAAVAAASDADTGTDQRGANRSRRSRKAR